MSTTASERNHRRSSRPCGGGSARGGRRREVESAAQRGAWRAAAWAGQPPLPPPPPAPSAATAGAGGAHPVPVRVAAPPLQLALDEHQRGLQADLVGGPQVDDHHEVAAGRGARAWASARQPAAPCMACPAAPYGHAQLHPAPPPSQLRHARCGDQPGGPRERSHDGAWHGIAKRRVAAARHRQVDARHDDDCGPGQGRWQAGLAGLRARAGGECGAPARSAKRSRCALCRGVRKAAQPHRR